MWSLLGWLLPGARAKGVIRSLTLIDASARPPSPPLPQQSALRSPASCCAPRRLPAAAAARRSPALTCFRDEPPLKFRCHWQRTARHLHRAETRGRLLPLRPALSPRRAAAPVPVGPQLLALPAQTSARSPLSPRRSPRALLCAAALAPAPPPSNSAAEVAQPAKRQSWPSKRRFLGCTTRLFEFALTTPARRHDHPARFFHRSTTAQPLKNEQPPARHVLRQPVVPLAGLAAPSAADAAPPALAPVRRLRPAQPGPVHARGPPGPLRRTPLQRPPECDHPRRLRRL